MLPVYKTWNFFVSFSYKRNYKSKTQVHEKTGNTIVHYNVS